MIPLRLMVKPRYLSPVGGNSGYGAWSNEQENGAKKKDLLMLTVEQVAASNSCNVF
jgi:hypothetical protein